MHESVCTCRSQEKCRLLLLLLLLPVTLAFRQRSPGLVKSPCLLLQVAALTLWVQLHALCMCVCMSDKWDSLRQHWLDLRRSKRMAEVGPNLQQLPGLRDNAKANLGLKPPPPSHTHAARFLQGGRKQRWWWRVSEEGSGWMDAQRWTSDKAFWKHLHVRTTQAFFYMKLWCT